MAECTRSQTLDPVQGLIDYTLLTKPYHSKILEVLVEYIHTDCLDVTITEGWWLSIGMPDPSLLCLWGWTEEEAKRYFNCDWEIFQITETDCAGNYFEVLGDKEDKFSPGDVILVRTDEFLFYQFTVSSVSTVSDNLVTTYTECRRLEDGGSSLTNVPDCQTYENVDCDWTPGSPHQKPPRIGRVVTCRDPLKIGTEYVRTRIVIDETLPCGFESNAGVLYPADCWVYNERDATYSFKAGLVWPSHVHVMKNAHCGGYGIQFEYLLEAGEGIPNPIVGVSTSLNYFEIDNFANTPIDVPNWQSILKYGVKIQVTDSLENNGIYTVLTSQLVYTSSSPTGIGSPQILRVYTIGNVSSSIVDGNLIVNGWGYDEPRVCVDEGQALRAQSHIAEDFIITLNENGAGIVLGWDMQHWDIAGWDGGSFTYTLTHT